jgi:ABC-type nickel/cobalt efflux system permease component RcnA
MSKISKLLPAYLAWGFMLSAHPMGNFSISHYSKLHLTSRGIELEYALDLAEIPTSALFSTWNVDRSAPQSELDQHAQLQAREWLKNLTIEVDGKPVLPRFESANLVIADGAGNLPILRITTLAHIEAQGGVLNYEDHNFPERTGWKEIVVSGDTGTKLIQASQTDADVSHALTQYPADPLIAPPQDLRARVEWLAASPTTAPKPLAERQPKPAPVLQPIAQPKTIVPAAAPATMTTAGAPAGSVVKGDFLSRLLHQRELTTSMILLALGAAFLLGAAHALTPGHGKAIVAAYLVGSRGTIKHAAFLGAMVTFTHTISVFALGLATLFLYRFIVPEKITAILGTISGLSIVAVGAWMLMKRIRSHRSSHSHEHLHVHDHQHAHAHSHNDGHTHEHVHSHDHGHTHAHDHGVGVHSHGRGHSHSHVPEEMSWKGLVALGVSGGLVPCESALVLLLGAIALDRVALGLMLLVAFSLGLALVLVAIGVMVLYAKNLLPANKERRTHPLLKWAAIASPAVVIVVGFVMTGVSLGWIQSKWMIG